MSQAPTSSPHGQQGQVLKAAGAMGVATLLSRVMGLVREQVFAFLFGASNAMDAFNVAFRIPNLLRDLFAEGAMSASLVPTFTRTRVEEGDDRAWRVAGLVFRVLFVAVLALALLGILFAPELVSMYAPRFREVPGKFEIAVKMTRTMFLFFPLVALAAAYMGILNACGKFFWPAFASALFNIVSVVVGASCAGVLFVWGPEWGIHPIEGMAWGVVAGGAAQAFCQLPVLYRSGYRWPGRAIGSTLWPVWYRDPRLRSMLWMMVPGTVGLAATQVNILINTILATSQGTGAVSWLNYAFRLMQFPIGVFGVSLASAVLPVVSRQWVERDLSGVEATLQKSIRRVLAINLPAAAGLIFLGEPIVSLLFQYGHFYAEDARATAGALSMYAWGLVAYSAVKVLVPACYAVGNTKIPVISSLLAVALTIVLNLSLVGSWGYQGLAFGTSAAATVNALFLVVALRRVLRRVGGGLGYSPLARALAAYFVLAGSMGLICAGTQWGLSSVIPDGALGVGAVVAVVRAVKLGVSIGVGVGWVALVARLFRLSEAVEVLDLFVARLKNKLSPLDLKLSWSAHGDSKGNSAAAL